jgi:hypothetical protein
MAQEKRTPPFQIRLSSEDQNKFEILRRLQGKSRSEMGRTAINWYIEHHDKLAADKRESILERRMKKMEDRLAALHARTAIDVGLIYHLIWRNMDKNTRSDALAWAYNSTIARLKRKLVGKDAEIKELVKDDPVSS